MYLIGYKAYGGGGGMMVDAMEDGPRPMQAMMVMADEARAPAAPTAGKTV